MPDQTPALATGTRKSRRYRRGALLLIPGFIFSSGCLYKGKEATDDTVKTLAARPYDPLPDQLQTPATNFQPTAAENSPPPRQAASDVQAARGNLIQTATYANPNFSLQAQPSNNSSTSGAFGFTVDQVVQTGGKMRLQTAAAQKAVDNAELALRRARSDL